tara:strand:+ start:89 stop:472 length:384 start_codon:yes stop_codon:yes gene_type:complete
MNQNDESYEPEESIFINLLGDYPLIRILNNFLIFREFDYSLTDVAESSNVAWSTLNLLWPKLEKNKIVVHTRNVGKAKMYKLDVENKIVQDLIKFADSIVWNYTDSEILKEETEKQQEVEKPLTVNP